MRVTTAYARCYWQVVEARGGIDQFISVFLGNLPGLPRKSTATTL